MWKVFAGAVVVANICGAAITGVETTVGARTASHLTGTTSVAVDGAAEVSLILATDNTFAKVTHTANQTASGAETLAFPLADLCPGMTYSVRVVATDGEGATVTNDSSFTVASGYTQMCYKPDPGKSVYPWADGSKWYPASSTPNENYLGYAPSLGDDVLLYSSKNDLLGGKPPMTIGAGVHAETKVLTVTTGGSGASYRIGVTVQSGGTMTNADHVYLGNAGNGKIGSGSVKVEEGGEWTANKGFFLANSSGTSLVEIAAGGTLTVGGEFIVGNNYGLGIATNSGTMNIKDLFVGNQSGRGILENRGVINVSRKVTFGRNEGSGNGYIHLAAGSVLNKRYTEAKPLFLGYMQDATIEMEGTINFLDKNDELDMGRNSSGVTGRLVMDGAAVITNLTVLNIGNNAGARGEVEMKGESAFIAGENRVSVYVARNDESFGELRMSGNATILNPTRFRIGQGGGSTGVVELAGNAVVSNINEQQVWVCAQTNSWASLTIADNARLCVVTNLEIGTKKNSWGELRFRGGSVTLNAPASSGWHLDVGYNDAGGTHGRVCGWGRFVKDGPNQLRLTSAAQFIADGEGEAHDLDLSVFRTSGSSASTTSNQCGSNGWYAVHGGRLLYPRTQNCTAGQMNHPAIGDYPTRTANPQLVNAFRFDMTTPPTRQYYNYVALYAPDRTDIPALPTGTVDRVQAVLRVGTSSSLTTGSVEEPPNPIGFAGCGFILRYDAAGLDVPEDEKPYRVRLYRHDGTADGYWTLLAEQEHNPTAPLISCLDNRFDPSTDAWNWGWFAVVAHRPQKGMTVIFR